MPLPIRIPVMFKGAVTFSLGQIDTCLSFQFHNNPDNLMATASCFFNGAIETVSASVVQGRSESDSPRFVGAMACVHYE